MGYQKHAALKIKIPDSIVAIDGYSSCGKSTLAKDLAKELDYRFIDSGAMYRSCTLYFLNHKIPLDDTAAINKALDQIHIDFKVTDQGNTTYLNGENVEDQLRSLRVSNAVSEVAAIKEVRRRMVELQQAMGDHKRIVMDGRDIGSVVFPLAEHKLFITADKSIRAQRRYDELKAKGNQVNIIEIMDNLAHRDHIDSTRTESPLIQTEDHILIDNSYLSRAEQVIIALKHIQENVQNASK